MYSACIYLHVLLLANEEHTIRLQTLKQYLLSCQENILSNGTMETNAYIIRS